MYAVVGLSIAQIGWLAAIYPAVWNIGQLFARALSDRTGRKWLIAYRKCGDRQVMNLLIPIRRYFEEQVLIAHHLTIPCGSVRKPKMQVHRRYMQ